MVSPTQGGYPSCRSNKRSIKYQLFSFPSVVQHSLVRVDRCLLTSYRVSASAYNSAVLQATQELLTSRNFSSVVAIASEALQNDPQNTDMRLLRAQALLALRRDEDAQADLSHCLQQKTRCALGYRLLGELCFRRDDFEAAQLFLNEAVHLDPCDQGTRDLAAVVDHFLHSLRQQELTLQPVAEPTIADGSVVDSFSSEFSSTLPRAPRLIEAAPTPKPQIEIVEDFDIDAPSPSEPGYFGPPSDLDFAGDPIEAIDGITVANPPMFVVDEFDQRPWLSPNAETIFTATAAPVTVPEQKSRRMAQGSEFDEPTIPAATFTLPARASERTRVDKTKASPRRRKLPPPSHWV